MDPARYQQLIGLFETLCDLETEEREARLAALRATDPALADALGDMLQADDEPPAFLETPALRCPVCQQSFPADAEFCPTHGARLRPAVLQTDPLLGVVLDGRYRIDMLIGRGGMGAVYRGHQINVGRDVAIKVLRHDLQHHPEVARRFDREARIIAGLRHPNTLKLIDFGHTPFGTLYIVNPLLRGRSLDTVISEDGPLDVPRTLSLMRQVTSALVEAHAADIVHRDLKPANIFVEQVGGEEVFKVLDFGVAKLNADTTEQTATGALVGTPAYMSPEQISADRDIDGRSDLYSLGVVAYVSLTGNLPWFDVTPTNVVHKHLDEPPNPLNQVLRRPVSDEVESLVMRLLSKAPDDRPADAQQTRALVEALERGGSVTGEQAALVVPAPAADKRPMGLIVGGAVALLAVIVAVWAWPTAPGPESDAPATAPASTPKSGVPTSTASRPPERPASTPSGAPPTLASPSEAPRSVPSVAPVTSPPSVAPATSPPSVAPATSPPSAAAPSRPASAAPATRRTPRPKRVRPVRPASRAPASSRKVIVPIPDGLP